MGWRIMMTGTLLAAALVTQAGTIYRSVDEHGRVSYSDRPSPGAEAMDVRRPNIERSIDPPAWEAAAPERPGEEDFPGYDELSITEPEGAVANGLVPTEVHIHLRPELQPEHRLQLLVDGAHYATSRDTPLVVDQMDRGPHTLEVRVVDAAGRALKSSGEIEVYVHWPRINRPGAGG